MKKFGLFLLKNNIHLMTLVFLGWAVWAAFNWSGLALVQKLTLGMYALLIIHEYEEGYKGRFLDLMAGRLLQIDWRTLIPGVTHIAQDARMVDGYADERIRNLVYRRHQQ